MNLIRADISQEIAIELLEYDVNSGVFKWRESKRSAGCLGNHGYLIIGLKGRLYLAHRLAWFYCFGEWPSKNIDHIDGNKINNALKNLRIASHAQNINNSGPRSTSKSGVKGVSWDSYNCKWRATINLDGKQRNLGRYELVEDAAKAYKNEAKKIQGEFMHKSTELGVTFYELER